MNPLVTLAVTLSGALAPALAQAPAAPIPMPAPAALAAAVDHVWFDRPGDGALWARTARYKARFDTSGATYVPYLGPQAPRNYPVDFTLASVTLGGRAIPFAQEVGPVRSGDLVTFDRGSFAELYVLSPDSIEQMFRIDAPIPGSGDLIVRLAVTSDLERGEGSDGILFSNELGGVHYGRAYALGAGGTQEALLARLDSDGIEIRVPASTLARCTYPLLVDPVISTFGIDTSNIDDRQPDAALDEATGEWCVVWQRPFSLQDHDLYSIMVDADGALLPNTAMWIDLTLDDWRRPRIAYSNADDVFLVVAEEHTPPSIAISGRMRYSNAVGPELQISSSGTQHCEPVVGGSSDAFSPGRFCVAWVTSASPLDWYVRTAVLFSTPEATVVHNEPFGWHLPLSHPSISRSSGSGPALPDVWTVVVEAENSPSDHDILAGQVTDIGTTPLMIVHDNATVDTRNPTVSTVLDGSGFLRRFMVAFEYDTGIVKHLVGMTGDGDPSGWSPLLNLTTMMGFPVSARQYTPALDSDGSSFSMVFTDSWNNDRTLHTATFYPAHGTLSLVDTALVADTMEHAEDACIAAGRSSGGDPQSLFIAWDDSVEIPPSGDIFGATYHTPDLGESFCTANLNSAGTAAHITARGTQSLWHNDMTLVVDGAPPNKPGLFFVGSAPVSLPFGEGRRCAGGPVGRISPIVTTDSGGHVERALDFDLPYGNNISANSPNAYYQLWYRDPAGGPAGFNLSDGLHVEHTF